MGIEALGPRHDPGPPANRDDLQIAPYLDERKKSKGDELR